jgi:hypothetical protein
MPEAESSTNDVELIPEYVAENYRELVADENRNLTYDALADDAEKKNDANLAAWARREAAAAGKDITPKKAKGAGKTTRDLTDYNAATIDELKDLIAARGEIDTSGLSLKADFVAALELDDEQAAAQ